MTGKIITFPRGGLTPTVDRRAAGGGSREFRSLPKLVSATHFVLQAGGVFPPLPRPAGPAPRATCVALAQSILINGGVHHGRPYRADLPAVSCGVMAAGSARVMP